MRGLALDGGFAHTDSGPRTLVNLEAAGGTPGGRDTTERNNRLLAMFVYLYRLLQEPLATMRSLLVQTFLVRAGDAGQF